MLAASRSSVTWVEPWDYLCEEQSCSQSTPDGEFVYSDQDHVSDLGATLLSEGTTGHLESSGLLQLAVASR